MSRRLSRILAYVAGTPWALHYPAAQRMVAVLDRRIQGKRLEQAQIDEAIGADRDAYAERRAAARDARTRTGGAVAVVPVYGTILGRDWQFTQSSHGGTTSAEELIRTLRGIDADSSISTIVLDMDTPGGSVELIPEAAAVLAGLGKPVVAQVNTMAASAGYWLAAQADEIVASPSAELGSIGVYTMHVDEREALAQDGMSVTIVRAGANKVAANPYEALTPEALADIQKSVDEYHDMFVGAVASGRGVTRAAVRSKFGDGLVFRAREAVERGMADRIATLDETIARYAGGARPKRRKAAAANPITVLASIAAEHVELDEPAVEREAARLEEGVVSADVWRRRIDLI